MQPPGFQGHKEGCKGRRSQDPGNETSWRKGEPHKQLQLSPLPPARWNVHGTSPTKLDYKGGLRAGEHKPDTSQSLEGGSLNTGRLETIRSKGIKIPYV